MEENRKHIDELFREALGNYTETPPPAVWQTVEKRLDGKQPGRLPAWWGWLALILLLSIGGGALIMKNTRSNGKNISKTATIAESKTSNATPPLIALKPTLADTANTAHGITNESIKKTNNTVTKNRDRVAYASVNHANSAHPEAGVHHRHNRRTAAHSPANSTHTAGNNPLNSAIQRHSVKGITGKSADNNTSNADGQNAAVVKTDKKHASYSVHKASAAKPVKQQDNRSTQPDPTVIANKLSGKPHHTSRIDQSKDSLQNSVSVKLPTTEKVLRTVKQKHKIKNAINNIPAKQATTADITGNNTVVHKPASAKPVRNKAATAKASIAPNRATDATDAQIIPSSDVANKPLVPSKKHRFGGKQAVAGSNLSGKKSKPAEDAYAAVARPVSVAKAARKNHLKPAETKTAAAVSTPKPAARKHIPITTAATRSNFSNATPNAIKSQDQAVSFQSSTPDISSQTPIAPKSAPDLNGNPATEDVDTASEDSGTPYTMNSHRNKLTLTPEAGLAGGYSFGLAKPNAGEIIISPYFQMVLGRHFGLRFSPAYRFGNVASQNLAGGGTYYRITSNTRDSLKHIDSIGGQVTTKYDYYSHQAYDSLTTSYKIGGKTWAIDLPVTVSYELGNGFQVFGGPVFSYGSTIGVSSSQQQTTGITRNDTVLNSLTILPQSYFDALIHHTGQPYTTPPATPDNNPGSSFRIGYLAGLRFSTGRWQAELSLQQHLSGYNNISTAELRKIYSQPYIHFTIGYSLWKPRQPALKEP